MQGLFTSQMFNDVVIKIYTFRIYTRQLGKKIFEEDPTRGTTEL